MVWMRCKDGHECWICTVLECGGHRLLEGTLSIHPEQKENHKDLSLVNQHPDWDFKWVISGWKCNVLLLPEPAPHLFRLQTWNCYANRKFSLHDKSMNNTIAYLEIRLPNHKPANAPALQLHQLHTQTQQRKWQQTHLRCWSWQKTTWNKHKIQSLQLHAASYAWLRTVMTYFSMCRSWLLLPHLKVYQFLYW